MIIFMAWRNIWRNKTRSMVIIISVAIGLFAGIAVAALYKGMMKSRIRTIVEAELGHLQMHEKNFLDDHEPKYFLVDGTSLLNAVSVMPEVRLAVPRSVTNGMLATPTGSAGVQVNGILPRMEYDISRLDLKVKEGRLFDPARRNEIMVGKKLATKMKLKEGSKLVLTFTDSSGEMVAGAFRVAAIYESDNAPLDEKNVYVTMNDLNQLLGIGSQFHEIAILLKRDEDLDRLKFRLVQRFPSVKVESWVDISPETDLMVKTADQYAYIIIVIIMIALAFGIINTMLMAILERTREIGMMIALGTSRLNVFLLILAETFMLTFAGIPFGVLVSWLLIGYFNKHGLDLSGMGREMMSSFGYSTFIYPAFPGEKMVGILLIVVVTAVVASLFPALKALRLSPVDALRR